MSEGEDGGDGKTGGRWIGLVQVGSVVVVAVLALYFMRAPQVVDLGDVSAREPSGVAQVEVVRPTAAERSPTVVATGTVALHSHVEMSSEVHGQVVWVSPKLRNGGEFKAGEPLLKIDPEEFERRVRSAEAGVAESRARLRKHELTGQRDAAAYERANPGSEAPAIVRREPQMARFRARVEAAEVALEGARSSLSRTTYSLPFDGMVVTAQEAAVGALAGPLVSFGRAYSRDALEVVAPVPLADLARLDPAVGRPAKVRIGARVVAAVVERVSARVGRTTRMADLFIKFAEDVPLAEMPGPGVFVEVAVTGEPVADTFVLPEAAERPDGGVWVVADGVLRSESPMSYGHDPTGWLVAAFDAGDGVVVGAVPGAAEGLLVEAVAMGGDAP